MTNLTHNSFLCIYFNSLHVSSNLMLIIRRINFINTACGICHPVSVTVSCAGRKGNFRPAHDTAIDTEWHIPHVVLIQLILLMMSTRLLETCRVWNQHIEKNCASRWSFSKNRNKMHGEQNIKIPQTFLCWYNIKNPQALWRLPVPFNLLQPEFYI